MDDMHKMQQDIHEATMRWCDSHREHAAADNKRIAEQMRNFKLGPTLVMYEDWEQMHVFDGSILPPEGDL